MMKGQERKAVSVGSEGGINTWVGWNKYMGGDGGRLGISWDII